MSRHITTVLSQLPVPMLREYQLSLDASSSGFRSSETHEDNCRAANRISMFIQFFITSEFNVQPQSISSGDICVYAGLGIPSLRIIVNTERIIHIDIYA